MKITVLFGSHRFGGTNGEIENMITGLPVNHQFEFLHMADHKVDGCISCYQCAQNGRCILSKTEADCFEEIFNKFINSDAILIITPVYAGIPSRLTALFERMTSILFATGLMNTDDNPLLNKKVGVFNYCSNKICDDTSLKLIFQKFVMKNYSFDDINYNFLNQNKEPNNDYGSINEYIKQVILDLDNV